MSDFDSKKLTEQIKTWGRELGFQQIGITDIDLGPHESYLKQWLNAGYQGEMTWMQDHGEKRFSPEALHPGTVRVISARMDYLPGDSKHIAVLKNSEQAYIARYALGRDYHKLIRKRLAQLAKKIENTIEGFGLTANQRPFVDSAPVMERPLAEKAGLGWAGKNTLIIHEKAGSWFFLGEIYTNIPLEIDTPAQKNRCGECTACLKVCPTDAFPKPYVLDARRCISYLTIEFKGIIPEEFRGPIGNRIFGCDDCQAICPWNKYAKPSCEKDFTPRHNLDAPDLLSLFLWTEKEFLKLTEGSPIRRVGYEFWLRNLAVALGNAPQSEKIINALKIRREQASDLVREHIDWAIAQQENPKRKKIRKIKAKLL